MQLSAGECSHPPASSQSCRFAPGSLRFMRNVWLQCELTKRDLRFVNLTFPGMRSNHGGWKRGLTQMEFGSNDLEKLKERKWNIEKSVGVFSGGKWLTFLFDL